MQDSELDMVSTLCQAANLTWSYHFARQQTWHGQRRPAAHGHQAPGSPAPGWGWRMQWSAHSTSCCSLGWTWSCLPVGYSTSCAPLGSAQAVPLITGRTPHRRQYCSSEEIPLITKCVCHKVPPLKRSARLAAETVFSQFTVSVRHSTAIDHKEAPSINKILLSDCACCQQRSCSRHSVFLRVCAAE